MTRFFVAKAWLGGLGLVVGLVGIAWDRPALVAAAIALLAIAVVLGLIERRGRSRNATP